MLWSLKVRHPEHKHSPNASEQLSSSQDLNVHPPGLSHSQLQLSERIFSMTFSLHFISSVFYIVLRPEAITAFAI
jgi:hypothetical protein